MITDHHSKNIHNTLFPVNRVQTNTPKISTEGHPKDFVIETNVQGEIDVIIEHITKGQKPCVKRILLGVLKKSPEKRSRLLPKIGGKLNFKNPFLNF